MKKFISIAVAGVVGAVGFASVASADASFYGRVTAGAVHTDNDRPDDDGTWNFGTTGDGLATRLGFRGSKDLGSGMEAGFQIERQLGDDEDATDNFTKRHQLAYISGSWGKLTIGNQNNPYMSARNWDQTYLYGGQIGYGSSYRHEGITYSMSNGAFSLDIMAMASEDNVVVTSARDAVPGTTVVHYYTTAPAATATSGATRITDATGANHVSGVPLGITLDAMGNPAATQPATACSAASATCALGYTLTAADTNPARGGADPSSLTRTGGGTAAVPAVVDDNSGVDGWIARVGYDFGVAAVNVAHQTNETEAANGRNNTAIGVNGSVGSLDWYLAYQTSELANTPAGGNDGEVDSWGGFLGFNMSEKDTIYAYHVSHSQDAVDADPSETILGYSRDMGPGVRFIAEYLALDTDTDADGSDTSKLALAVRYVF